jgi:hypothetical protein
MAVMVAGLLLCGGANLKLSKALIEMSKSDAEEEPTPQERIERLRFDVSVERYRRSLERDSIVEPRAMTLGARVSEADQGRDSDVYLGEYGMISSSLRSDESLDRYAGRAVELEPVMADQLDL